MTVVVSFLVMLGILVFVHEGGHFVVAKLFRIRVLRFSLGFGKVLVRRTWKGTEFALSMIPLGGYVKMAGGDESEATGAKDEFLSQPPYVRMIVALSGPVVNVALAVLLYAAVAKVGYTLYTYPNRIGGVMETVEVGGREIAAPAAGAGFEPGDVVAAIEGQPTPYWSDLQRHVNTNPGRRLSFDVVRGGKKIVLWVTPVMDGESGRGIVGLLPYQGPKVAALTEKGLAAKAGVRRGDVVTAVDGEAVTSFNDLLAGVQRNGRGERVVTFASPGGKREVRIVHSGDLDKFVQDLGVVCGLIEVKKSSTWAGAIPEGLRQTKDVIVLTARSVSWLVKGTVKPSKVIGGPITLARAAGETARAGVVVYISYLGYVSVMLGIMNLLPIPVLDGGHIVVGLIETIRRRNISARAREIAYIVGFVLILGVLAFGLYADINRLFGG